MIFYSKYLTQLLFLKSKWAAFLCLFVSAVMISPANAETQLIMSPSISKTQLAFIYGGDLWVSNKKGQNLKKLTTSVASESDPHFSPDGKWIAFSSNENNNMDVYIIPANGGQATRLTYHPGNDRANGWSADGKKVLFTSRREMRQGRSAQAWEVSIKGGLPTKVMDAVVMDAKWSPDGKTLAYQPYITAHLGASGWRNHRGGSTPPIWILKPNGDSYTEIPHQRASDTNPLWVGNDVYFISDRNRVKNIWRYDSKTQKVSMSTNEKVWDIISADAYKNQIVFNTLTGVKLLNTSTGKVNKLSISIHTNLPERKVAWKKAMPSMELASISPTGKRVLLSARGEVFTVPVKKGSPRNLTQTDRFRERDALWSPDGKTIAFTSDQSGEQEITLTDQYGKVKKSSIKFGTDGDIRLLKWGPKSKFLYFQDNHLRLWSLNVDTGHHQHIVTNNRRSSFDINISSDGRWLAYVKARANYFNDLYIYDSSSQQSHLISDGMSNITSPAFSKDGKYLYFLASTNSGTTAVGLDMSTQERPSRFGIYAFVLNKNEKSPLYLESDEESAKSDKNDEKVSKNGAKDAKSDNSADKKSSKKIRIDFEGLSQRLVSIPVAQSAYSNLETTQNGNLLYLESDQPGDKVGMNGRAIINSRLKTFDFKTRKDSLVKSDIVGFIQSFDGKSLLLIDNNSSLSIASLKGGVSKDLKAKRLNTENVKVKIHPANEWAQIFDEVWRTERDYFYAANMHGLDWKGIGERYRKLLPSVARRADLNRLMIEMIAEMQVGHNRIFGGDMPQLKTVNVGLLGANFRIRKGLYQISTIFSGENWNPGLSGPLLNLKNAVNEGDFILSINGIKLTSKMNIFALLENTVGQQIRLEVSPNGKEDKSKIVIVKPIASENALRFWEWIESNRKYVQKKTKGKTGYVYLPDTAGGGFTLFNRMFFAQTDKHSMIIDERRNSGGQAANYITDILTRKYLASWRDRDGMLFDTPGGAVYGPKVMLIDQDAGSGGDFLPYSFKYLKIGKLIGKTTWGGLIGIAANRQTIDGGMVLVPFFRFFTAEGKWAVENQGVSPDIDVTLDPVKVNKGIDVQLDRAILEVTQELKNYKPIRQTHAPKIPDKVGH